MKKLAINFHKSVSYWNNTEGALVDIHGNSNDERWSTDASYLDATLNIEGVSAQEVLLKHLSDNFYATLKSDHLNITEDGRLSLCLIEDGEGNVIQNTSEYAQEYPTEQTYICDYDIMVEVHEVSAPTEEELGAMFPNVNQ